MASEEELQEKKDRKNMLSRQRRKRLAEEYHCDNVKNKKSPELIQAILDTITNERISNADACRMHGISEGQWFDWMNADAGIAERYARAKFAQSELMAKEILTIADDTTEDANSRRVRVDARKWLLSKLIPKKYGDKLELSGDPEAPLVVVNIRRAVKE